MMFNLCLEPLYKEVQAKWVDVADQTPSMYARFLVRELAERPKEEERLELSSDQKPES